MNDDDRDIDGYASASTTATATQHVIDMKTADDAVAITSYNTSKYLNISAVTPSLAPPTANSPTPINSAPTPTPTPQPTTMAANSSNQVTDQRFPADTLVVLCVAGAFFMMIASSRLYV